MTSATPLRAVSMVAGISRTISMKRLPAFLILTGLMPLFAHAAALSPSLFINVDTVAKEYYLSGTATGYPASTGMGGPGGMEGPGGMGGYEVFWDNYQPYDGGYENLLSESAFVITGNSGYDYTLFFHGNGNINGAFNFSSGGSTTLTGDSTLRFSYAGWSEYMIAELEDKVVNQELVVPSSGDMAFTLQFTAAPAAAIPEPATGAALAGAITLTGVVAVRRRERRA